jgi:hypothetical protein
MLQTTNSVVRFHSQKLPLPANAFLLVTHDAKRDASHPEPRSYQKELQYRTPTWSPGPFQELSELLRSKYG